MREFSLLTVALCLLSFLFGCESPENTPQNQISGTGAKADWSMGEEAFAAVPEMGGDYHIWMISEIISKNNDSGDTTNYRSEARAIGTISQVGNSITMETSPCDLTLPTLGVGQPSVSTEALRNLPPLVTHGNLIPQDGYTRMEMESSSLVLGAYLNHPDEPLPTHKEDLNVIDADDDGKPGVSISIAGFDIYSTLRLVFQLSGWLYDNETVSGETDMQVDYTILGDNVPFINVTKKVAKAGEASSITEQTHWFVMARVDPSKANCHAIEPHPMGETDDGELPPLFESEEESGEEDVTNESSIETEAETGEGLGDSEEDTDESVSTDVTIEEEEEEEEEEEDEWDDWYF